MKFLAVADYDLRLRLASGWTWLFIGLALCAVPIQAAMFHAEEVLPTSIYEMLVDHFKDPKVEPKIAVVDLSGWVKTIPSDLTDYVAKYEDEKQALKSFDDKTTNSVVVVSESYAANGGIEILRGESDWKLIARLLSYNVFEAGTLEHRMLEQLATSKLVTLDAVGNAVPEKSALALIPLALAAVSGIIYTLFLLSVVNTVGASIFDWLFHEQHHGCLPLILSSISPVELFAGKAIAKGIFACIFLAAFYISNLFFISSSPSMDSFLTSMLPVLRANWLPLAGITIANAVCAGGLAILLSLFISTYEKAALSLLIFIMMCLPLMFLEVLLWTPQGLPTALLTFTPFSSGSAVALRLVAGNLSTAATLSNWDIVGSILVSLLIGLSAGRIGFALWKRKLF